MDALAAAVADASNLPRRAVTAAYFETEDGGVGRLRTKEPTLAMVPLAFYLEHARDLALVPRAQVVPRGGEAMETWTLVAKKGRVTSASSLSGFTIVSLASYAPQFIRGVALRGWGSLPGDVTFTESGQVLSALRRAAGGDDVAVLLDEAQASSVKTLPFAAQLEGVATSPRLPGIVVCTVGGTVREADAGRMVAGLLRLHETAEGRAALDTVRMSRFVPLDERALAASRSSYAALAKTSAP